MISMYFIMVERIKYIDAYRGLAVILMVQQHLQNWLWHKQWLSYGVTFPQHPFMLSLNFLGNFPAAMFLISAGIGSAILYDSRIAGLVVFKRGMFILFCGYLLNLISPHWFKPGSWYILHTIGIALMLSPLLNKIRTAGLILMFSLFIITPAFIQTWLNTPLLLGNDYMNDISMKGGVARLIFAEGHFPIIPWTGFFVIGIICQRMIENDKKYRILLISILLISAGLLLRWFYTYGFFFATGGFFFRLFVFVPYVYPPLPSLIMFVGGVSILLLFLFLIFDKYKMDFTISIFSFVGRLSLSWFFIHIIVFNEISALIGIRKTFSASETLIIIFLTIIIMLILSFLWDRKKCKFSLEWFMRKVVKL